MRRICLLVWLGMVATATIASADAIPWRGVMMSGEDTVKIRIDPGVFDTSIQKHWNWRDTQELARNNCMACGAGKWGAQELARAAMAKMTKDQGYRPLEDWIFLLVSIEVVGPSSSNPTWRFSHDEQVVLTMHDNSVLISEPPREMPEPSPNLQQHSEAYINKCRTIRLMLGGRVLYKSPKLVELGQRHREYRDDPSNAFLIPFKHKDPPRDFLKGVRGVKVRIGNQWVELQSTATAMSQVVGSQ